MLSLPDMMFLVNGLLLCLWQLITGVDSFFSNYGNSKTVQISVCYLYEG